MRDLCADSGISELDFSTSTGALTVAYSSVTDVITTPNVADQESVVNMRITASLNGDTATCDFQITVFDPCWDSTFVQETNGEAAISNSIAA